MWNPFKRTTLSLSVENSWTFHCEGPQEAVEGFYTWGTQPTRRKP